MPEYKDSDLNNVAQVMAEGIVGGAAFVGAYIKEEDHFVGVVTGRENALAYATALVEEGIYFEHVMAPYALTDGVNPIVAFVVSDENAERAYVVLKEVEADTLD